MGSHKTFEKVSGGFTEPVEDVKVVESRRH